MRIEVDWYDEAKNIIIQRYPADWSWDEFKHLQDIVPPMMREVSHIVHVVGDFSQHQHIPAGNPILHARNLMNSYPDNFGMLIIVTRPGIIESFVKAFINIFTGSFGSRILIVNRMEDVLPAIDSYQLSH